MNELVNLNGQIKTRAEWMLAGAGKFVVCLPTPTGKRQTLGYARGAQTVEALVAKASKYGQVAGEPRMHPTLHRLYVPVVRDGAAVDIEFWPQAY